MKFEKLLNFHVVTGIVLGLVIGLYSPTALGTLEPVKAILAIVGVIMGLKVVGLVK